MHTTGQMLREKVEPIKGSIERTAKEVKATIQEGLDNPNATYRGFAVASWLNVLYVWLTAAAALFVACLVEWSTLGSFAILVAFVWTLKLIPTRGRYERAKSSMRFGRGQEAARDNQAENECAKVEGERRGRPDEDAPRSRPKAFMIVMVLGLLIYGLILAKMYYVARYSH